jgi:hypothetical protein
MHAIVSDFQSKTPVIVDHEYDTDLAASVPQLEGEGFTPSRCCGLDAQLQGCHAAAGGCAHSMVEFVCIGPFWGDAVEATREPEVVHQEARG